MVIHACVFSQALFSTELHWRTNCTLRRSRRSTCLAACWPPLNCLWATLGSTLPWLATIPPLPCSARHLPVLTPCLDRCFTITSQILRRNLRTLFLVSFKTAGRRFFDHRPAFFRPPTGVFSTTDRLPPATDRLPPATAGYRPAIAGYRPDTTGYRPATVGYRRLPTGYRRLPTGYRRLPTGYLWLPTGYRRLPTGYRRSPATTAYRPATAGYRPATDRLPPTTDRLPPATADYRRLPTGYHRLPTGYRRLPPTTDRLPPTTAGYRPATAGYLRLPPATAGYQPATDRLPPVQKKKIFFLTPEEYHSCSLQTEIPIWRLGDADRAQNFSGHVLQNEDCMCVSLYIYGH